ncbi:hypothetical protein P3T76_007151 [Phytophthora citrophthora]|uniref:Uncharacterized protein n=1 Tax=Phytophthora citrophthora TaxID=4793 RepID=A0AAD9LLP3_9STRA|nr:hypothetical protein P3T76_007151 [Phytophthora citrophthora]
MEADDEPAMAYFLPNGIADDSPPKKSRIKASFGPIGGRSTATISQQTSNSLECITTVSAAQGPSNSRSDMNFSGLHTRPRPTLDSSPFGASGGSASASNFLLSDLGGEIHTPRGSRDFGDAGGPTSSSSGPFGFTGPFGSGLSDTGAIGGAGAIRSPSSMFDRGQEAAKSFTMQGDNRSSRGTTGAYGGTEAQLYRGGMSYLSAGDSNSPFGSNSMRTWPSTNVSQPRRVLQRPPGLAGPPGLSEPDAMQPRMRLGSGDMMPQRAPSSQFGPFHPSTSPSIAVGDASSRGFASTGEQYGSSLLSNLRLSTGMFSDSSIHDQSDGQRVSNPDLAELNSYSVKVGEMDGMHIRQAVDSSSAMWDNREPTTSRRIDIQARSKTPRSPKKAREGRKKPEGHSDLRAKALEFSMDAINAFTPGSPMRPRRSERGRKITSSIGHDSPLENNRSNDQTRGKRRNQVVSSASAIDARRRVPTNQTEESGPVLAPPPGLEAIATPGQAVSRESGKFKRRDDTKPSSRNASRKNPTRGNEKGPITRRQVYREKQVKETTKDLSLPEETTPSAASPNSSISPKESQVSSDSLMLEGELLERNETYTPKIQSKDSSPKTAEAVSNVSTRIKANATAKPSTDKVETAKDQHADVKNSDIDDGESAAPVADTLSEDPTTNTERASTSSSDTPEYAVEDLAEEPRANSPDSDEILSSIECSESDVEQVQAPTTKQRAQSTRKAKKKSTGPVEPSAETSTPAENTEAETSVPLKSSQPAVAERKNATKEHRKDKPKKDKADKKKTARGKKDKRGSSLVSKPSDAADNSVTEAQDKLLEALATKSTPLPARLSQGLRKGYSTAVSAGLLAFLGTRRGCMWAAGRLNMKGFLASTFSYMESVLAVVFSVVLLLSLHAASWFIRIHRVAFRAILTHRHIGFCFAFLYGFPFLVQYVFPWAPPWAPVCLWYAFLVQLFCTNGPTAMVTTFRVILPLVFLVEGISHHSFLLDFNGAELLLTSFIISALKTSNLCSPVFFLSLATQCLLAVFLGSELIVQWLQLALALYSLHVMAVTDDEWIGIGEEDDEISCHPGSLHHSIAEYNHHPAPSSAVSIQKTKRLDRRALAYVRGRKLR